MVSLGKQTVLLGHWIQLLGTAEIVVTVASSKKISFKNLGVAQFGQLLAGAELEELESDSTTTRSGKYSSRWSGPLVKNEGLPDCCAPSAEHSRANVAW